MTRQKETSCECTPKKQEQAPVMDTNQETATLITTHTCPNCKIAKNFLAKKEIPYRLVFSDDDPSLAQKLGITTVPTLVAPNGKIYIGAQAIMQNAEAM